MAKAETDQAGELYLRVYLHRRGSCCTCFAWCCSGWRLVILVILAAQSCKGLEHCGNHRPCSWPLKWICYSQLVEEEERIEEDETETRKRLKVQREHSKNWEETRENRVRTCAIGGNPINLGLLQARLRSLMAHPDPDLSCLDRWGLGARLSIRRGKARR